MGIRRQFMNPDYWCSRCGAYRPTEDHECPQPYCPVCGAENGQEYCCYVNLTTYNYHICERCGLYIAEGRKYDPRHDQNSPYFCGDLAAGLRRGFGADGWELEK